MQVAHQPPARYERQERYFAHAGQLGDFAQAQGAQRRVVGRVHAQERLLPSQDFLRRAFRRDAGTVHRHHIRGQALEGDLAFEQAVGFAIQQEADDFHIEERRDGIHQAGE